MAVEGRSLLSAATSNGLACLNKPSVRVLGSCCGQECLTGMSALRLVEDALFALDLGGRIEFHSRQVSLTLIIVTSLNRNSYEKH